MSKEIITMSRVIIVTGSARPNSISHKVVPVVQAALAAYRNIEAEVVDIAKLELPFFDAPLPPSQEAFVATDARVQAWTKLVAEANGVILLTPEYNGNVTAIQKNAIDWIYKEWSDKPVAFIGYGWYVPSRSQAALRVSFEQVLKAKLVEPFAQLQFMQDVSIEGEVLNQEAVDAKIKATLDAFAAALS
jgi:NAD(P)H-dependent FMN reductase